ncbi:MAG: glycosyltransferase, partial [Gammaproteobacteria bacterium]
IPVVSGFHTNFHTYTRHYHLGWMEPLIRSYLRRLHRATDCTLVPTGALAERLRRDHFGNVRVLARGVDTELFNPGHRCVALRQQWGVQDDTLVCLYVGRIAAEKNIGEAAAAVSGLRRRFPQARFVLVGDGPLRVALARRYPDFVFCGTRTGTELARHYASADVFLFPSRSETFGNVVTEAMASGLAVIAYDEAAAGEHVRHDRNGLLVRDALAPDFADTLLRLYRDPILARRLGRTAAQDCEALGWSVVIERFASLLRDTAASALQRPGRNR